VFFLLYADGAMNTNIDISIIIPAYNEAAYLPACINAIKQQKGAWNVEIIVVDNASTDNTAEVARVRGVRVVRETSRGVGRARSTGTAQARGRYVLHIDADTRLPHDYLSYVFNRFEQEEHLVCLGGIMTWYDKPAWINTIFVTLQIPACYVVCWMSRGALGPVGNNMTFRKDTYEKTSGFATDRKYGEEADLTRKLHKFGTVELDTHLRCPVSARRIQLNKAFFVYCLNLIWICWFDKPFSNVLPEVEEETTWKM